MKKIIVLFLILVFTNACFDDSYLLGYKGTAVVIQNTSNKDITDIDLTIKNTKNAPFITEQLGSIFLIKANDSAKILVEPKNKIFYDQLSYISSVVRGKTDTLEISNFYNYEYAGYPNKINFSIKPDGSLTGIDFFDSIPMVVHNTSNSDIKDIDLFIETKTGNTRDVKITEVLGKIPLVKANDSTKVLIKPANKLFYRNSFSYVYVIIKAKEQILYLGLLRSQLSLKKKYIFYIDKTGSLATEKPTN